MKTEEPELEWLCCFCGEVVKRTLVDPVEINISFPDGDGQGLRAQPFRVSLSGSNLDNRPFRVKPRQ